MGRLEGRVALITGAGGGIGRATAQQFLDEGAKVIALDISEAALEAASQALGQNCNAGSIFLQTCNVAEERSVVHAVQAGVAHYGTIDLLVNCAGGSIDDDGPIVDVDMSIFQRTMSVDLLGTMHCCRHVIPVMIERGRGSVVNMSSWAALRGRFHRHIYTAAKGGIISLTQALASEYAVQNIRVNAIAPGTIRTLRTVQRQVNVDQNSPRSILRRRMAQEYPFSVGDPIDIAHIAVFLASDESRMITGQTIAADGGRSAY
jgi:NAD(P)-dependent dehydrogenase (short-subunit alcohol dehydrogenase family)